MLRRRAVPLDKKRLSASSNCAPHRMSWKTQRRVVLRLASIQGFSPCFQCYSDKNSRRTNHRATEAQRGKNESENRRTGETATFSDSTILRFPVSFVFSVSLCLCGESVLQIKKPPKFPPMAFDDPKLKKRLVAERSD